MWVVNPYTDGTNVDLIEDRVKKGKCCIVNSMSLCSDVTMGIHAIETLFLLYHSLFIAVVLYNAQAWSNLTKTDLKALQTIQLRFLKRTFHAPSSTSNTLTFLETGILPIRYEIHIKQLVFQHHIITLEDDDIVRITYEEQMKYDAPNWANEISKLKKEYSIDESDTEIGGMGKKRWKRIVKKKVKEKALEDLNKEAQSQKQASKLIPYDKLAKQEYMTTLSPTQARKVFHIRTGTIDLRGVRQYTYGEIDTCRLCSAEKETVEHVVNRCPMVDRVSQVESVLSRNCEEQREMAKRCAQFQEKVDATDSEVG